MYLCWNADDGKSKPIPRPENKQPKKKTAASASAANKGAKPRSESVSEPEFMCLIRATYRSEKITTVVSRDTYSSIQHHLYVISGTSKGHEQVPVGLLQPSEEQHGRT